MKRVIVNADDYGLRAEIDEGILDCCRDGLVTSVSVMTNFVEAPAATALASLPVGRGVHLNLTHGRSAVDGSPLPRSIEEISARMDFARLRAEMAMQIRQFLDLFGERPTHLDTHKHAHVRDRLVLEAVVEAAIEYGVPVRSFDEATRRRLRRAGVGTSDHFVGGVGQEPYWSADRLARAFREMAPGTTELMCHPGRACPPIEGLFYVAQRSGEREGLLDPELRRVALDVGIELVTWRAAMLEEER